MYHITLSGGAFCAETTASANILGHFSCDDTLRYFSVGVGEAS